MVALWGHESADCVAMTTDNRELPMGEHWNIDGHQIGVNQPTHQLEKACEEGSGIRTGIDSRGGCCDTLVSNQYCVKYHSKILM